MGPLGGVTVFVTNPSSTAFSVCWSIRMASANFRDASLTTDRDGDCEIYTIPTDGTDLKRLTQSPDNDGHPAWAEPNKAAISL